MSTLMDEIMREMDEAHSHRLGILSAMADAEAAIAETPRVQLGPNGLEEVPPEPSVPWLPPVSRWTGKPRKNSKQARRRRGE